MDRIAALRRVAQTSNRKLFDLASDLVRTLLVGQRRDGMDDAEDADEDWEGPHPLAAPSHSVTWRMGPLGP